jgi:hypothetical protein
MTCSSNVWYRKIHQSRERITMNSFFFLIQNFIVDMSQHGNFQKESWTLLEI